MLSNIPLYDYTSFSPTTGPMSYFQFGGIMNKVAMTIHIQVLCGLMISFLLWKYWGVEFFRIMVAVHLVL